MFTLKGLVASLALGFVQDSIVAAAACCGADKCGVAIKLATNGKQDCSSFLIKTTRPTTTITSWRTITTDVLLTNVQLVTGSTDVTVTTIQSETAFSTSTSTATVDETATITAIPTVVETAFVVVTETVAAPLKKRLGPTKPGYASACGDAAYTSACVCLGVRPSTTAKSAATVTVWKTQTDYKTVGTTKNSLAGVRTNTKVQTLTTITTIVQGAVITDTLTIPYTVTAPTTVVQTLTSTTVVTLAPAVPTPPTCSGNGFRFTVTEGDSSVVGQFLGFVNSIGEGIYLQTFSGGGSAFALDADGHVVNWYPTSDLVMVTTAGPPPYQIMFTSVESNVQYTFATTPAYCTIGGAPNYALSCAVPSSGVNLSLALCRSFGSLYLWTYSDLSQLDSMACYTVTTAAAQCIPP